MKSNFIFGLILILLSANTILSQNLPDSIHEPISNELNEIIVTSVSQSINLKLSPIIIKPIDVNLLNQSSSTNLIDALKNIPGISQITTGASISSGSGTFTITFTNPVATSGTVSRMTLQTGDHVAGLTLCQQGITCSIGDAGPGGGKIFYYSASGFSCGASFTNTGSPTGGLCHYLEAAPSTAVTGTFKYATTGLENSDVSGITNDTNGDYSSSAIGLGYKNSLLLVNQGNDTTSAPGIARAYQGGTKSDWYLPSFSELNQMCKWARGVAWTSDSTICSGGTLNIGTGPGLGAAGFEANFYWSSSERESNNGWGIYFNGPTPDYLNKFHARYVRPVRAF